MKKYKIASLIFVLIAYQLALAQAIVIGTGASIYVPSGADICAGSHGNITGNLIGEGTQCDGALPVELSSFTAQARGTTVELNWVTETEVDNYGFDVERTAPLNPSQGGKQEDWRKIGFVEGHGNSNSPKEYSFIDRNPVGGSKFKYRLKQIDTDGKFEYSEEIEVEIILAEFAVYQNYPNPFNSSTIIRYSLPHLSSAEIFVFNTIGEEIKREVVENQAAGNYEWGFNGDNLSSGIYFYKLQVYAPGRAGSFVETKKMVLMK